MIALLAGLALGAGACAPFKSYPSKVNSVAPAEKSKELEPPTIADYDPDVLFPEDHKTPAAPSPKPRATPPPVVISNVDSAPDDNPNDTPVEEPRIEPVPQPEPVTPKSTTPEPATPEPAQPEPAKPEPSKPEPAAPQPPPQNPAPEREEPKPEPPPQPQTPAPQPQPQPEPEPKPEPQPAPQPPPPESPPPAQPPQPQLQQPPQPEPKRAKPQPGFSIPKEQRTEAVTKAVVACETMNTAGCPSAVGMLLAKDDNKDWMGQCTAFLISDRLLLTNSHCMPKNLKVDGADCRAQIQVFFPKTPNDPAESVGCERVLRASKLASSPYERAPDYALLQLARPLARKPFAMSRDGIADNTKLVFYSVEPQSLTEVRGLLRVRRCRALQFSTTSPSFVQPFAEVATIADCKFLDQSPGQFVHGNSGSPGIDSSGQVRAIEHAIIDPAPASKTARFQPIALATNLACSDLPDPANPLKPHDDCAKRLSISELTTLAFAQDDDRGPRALAATWLAKDAPKELDFKLERVESRTSRKHLIAPDLKCIKAPKTWANKSELSAASVIMTYKAPFWGNNNGQDEYYRISFTPAIQMTDDVTLSVDLREADANGYVSARMQTRLLRTSKNENFHLPVCEK